jgi:hypothetical protein
MLAIRDPLELLVGQVSVVDGHRGRGHVLPIAVQIRAARLEQEDGQRIRHLTGASICRLFEAINGIR